MKLRELLDLCYMRLFVIIENNENAILTDSCIDIDDFFACDKYRYLDDKRITYIDVKESDISDIPTLIITVI